MTKDNVCYVHTKTILIPTKTVNWPQYLKSPLYLKNYNIAALNSLFCNIRCVWNTSTPNAPHWRDNATWNWRTHLPMFPEEDRVLDPLSTWMDVGSLSTVVQVTKFPPSLPSTGVRNHSDLVLILAVWRSWTYWVARKHRLLIRFSSNIKFA